MQTLLKFKFHKRLVIFGELEWTSGHFQGTIAEFVEKNWTGGVLA